MLKNSALTGGTPCQCTSPGACQNSRDSGRYSTIDSHMALWKPGSSATSLVSGAPPRYTWANWPPSISADRPMMPRNPTAYSAPSWSMSLRRCRPVRNATSSTAGVGNRPWVASAAATIMASVADGSRVSAMAGPTSGTMLASDMAAIVMKNSAASAMGCRQNARTPSLTQAMPVRAGTIFSFMAMGQKEGGRAMCCKPATDGRRALAARARNGWGRAA